MLDRWTITVKHNVREGCTLKNFHHTGGAGDYGGRTETLHTIVSPALQIINQIIDDAKLLLMPSHKSLSSFKVDAYFLHAARPHYNLSHD